MRFSVLTWGHSRHPGSSYSLCPASPRVLLGPPSQLGRCLQAQSPVVHGFLLGDRTCLLHPHPHPIKAGHGRVHTVGARRLCPLEH